MISMVFIANAMTPFSPKDVTVYSNCDEVRLTYCKNGKQFIYKKEKTDEVRFRVPKGERARIQAHAEQHGESATAFIKRAIREAMERDNAAK